jgi:putative acetyltransferase
MQIVDETAAHRPAVLELNLLAFGGWNESEIVEKLDRAGLVKASLVALIDGKIVGHILFSELHVEAGGRKIKAVALAPMCVAPDRQRQGIGSELVRAGIDRMKGLGKDAIVVVGHERFYPRFGFRHDLVRNLACAFNRYEVFMGLELTSGCLGGEWGVCRYPEAFGS